MRGLRRALAPGWAALRQAVLALGAGGLPKLPLSPVMCAVLLGMLWRNTVGVPGWATRGLDWTMHRLLRVGTALVGLRLTLAGATAIALTALPVALSCLTVALLAGVSIARALAVWCARRAMRCTVPAYRCGRRCRIRRRNTRRFLQPAAHLRDGALLLT